MSLSLSATHRLTFAKYLVRRGQEESAKGHEAARAVAVLHFHDALELFLQCIADTAGVSASTRLNFPEYSGAIQKASGKQMLGLALLDRLNKVRVALKHAGVLPGDTAIRGLSGEVEAFFEQNAREFLAIDFGGLSIADMIVSTGVRDAVKTAERAIEQGRFSDAFAGLSAAFRLLTTEILPAQNPSRLNYSMQLDKGLVDGSDVPRLDDYSENERLRRMIEKMNKRYGRLVEALEPLRLGLDAGNYQRFRYLTGGPPSYSRALHGTRENAVFCLGFVVDAALRMQEGGPLLRDPSSRYTVEVESASVPVLRFSDDGLIEERRAATGERFESVELTVVLTESAAGLPGGEHWLIGEWDNQRRWEAVRFLPLAGVRIVEEHRQ